MTIGHIDLFVADDSVATSQAKRAATNFVLELTDATNSFYSPIVSTAIATPYNLSYGKGVIEISDTFSPITGQYFVAELTQAWSGTDGGVRVVELQASAIPEPSTDTALFGLAALGFAAYRKRHWRAG